MKSEKPVSSFDFREKEKIKTLLQSLPEDRKPFFGKMMPQQMVEHLIFSLEISTNKKPQRFHGKPEHLPRLHEFITGNREIEPGFRSPVLPEMPLPLQYRSMKEAMEVLLSNIDDFENYFKDNRQMKTINPVFGELNYEEWIRFHHKHFNHHFRQFDLVEMPVMKIARDYAFDYSWGNDCRAWFLVNKPSLSVLQEMMPPHTEEVKHFHRGAQQFFFILKGKATIEFENTKTKISAGEGIYIAPDVQHKIKNETEESIEFLLVSQPNAHGDRFNAE